MRFTAAPSVCGAAPGGVREVAAAKTRADYRKKLYDYI
jgi:hypothetical protein